MKTRLWLQSFLLLFAMDAHLYAAEQRADTAAKQPADKRAADDPQSKVLSPDEWRRLDAAIAHSLEWLITRQRPDGSFPTMERGQPGVTSLCVLAFMAHGHSAGEGKYGQQLDRAADFITA